MHAGRPKFSSLKNLVVIEIYEVKYNGTTIIVGFYHANNIQQTNQIVFVSSKLNWGG